MFIFGFCLWAMPGDIQGLLPDLFLGVAPGSTQEPCGAPACKPYTQATAIYWAHKILF